MQHLANAALAFAIFSGGLLPTAVAAPTPQMLAMNGGMDDMDDMHHSNIQTMNGGMEGMEDMHHSSSMQGMNGGMDGMANNLRSSVQGRQCVNYRCDPATLVEHQPYSPAVHNQLWAWIKAYGMHPGHQQHYQQQQQQQQQDVDSSRGLYFEAFDGPRAAARQIHGGQPVPADRTGDVESRQVMHAMGAEEGDTWARQVHSGMNMMADEEKVEGRQVMPAMVEDDNMMESRQIMHSSISDEGATRSRLQVAQGKDEILAKGKDEILAKGKDEILAKGVHGRMVMLSAEDMERGDGVMSEMENAKDWTATYSGGDRQ